VALDSQIEAADRGDTKPVARGFFDRFLDTVTDASPAQWATFTVDIIEHGRDIQLPRAEMLRVLAMVGIIDQPATRRGPDGKPIPTRAICSVCRTRRDLQRDGMVRSHKRRGEHCPGRHKPPLTEPGLVAS
jgi:hypothetical protein